MRTCSGAHSSRAQEREADVDAVDQREACADPQDSQLVLTTGMDHWDADGAEEANADVDEVGRPAEVVDCDLDVTEHAEIGVRCCAIDRALLGLEVDRIREAMLGRDRAAMPCDRICGQAIGHLERTVAERREFPTGLVLVCEAAATHLVRPAQQRGRDPRQLVRNSRTHHMTPSLRHPWLRCVRTLRERTAGVCQRLSTLAPVRIAIGGDHAGYPLKQHLVQVLKEWGHDVDDLGTHSEDPVDYPPYCAAVARAVVRGDAERGIVLGGSGQGEQISANKVHGARAALCNELYTARMARAHNDANVLSIGARIVAAQLAEEIVRLFLETPFEGGRHVRRLEEITEIEAEESRDAPAAPAAARSGESDND